MAKKSNGYDDKAEELMQYIQMRQTAEGEKIKIQDQKGLIEYLSGLNAAEKQSKSKPRMSQKYIRGVAESSYARSHLPKTFGGFGRVTMDFGLPSERSPATEDREKVIRAKNKAEGRQTYRYPGGLAVRAKIKMRGGSKDGPKYRYGFRDATTGRLVSKKDIAEDAD